LNNAVKKQEWPRCPHCDSHELFEKVKGCLTICLVCFKTIKVQPQSPGRKIAWTRVAIGVGVGAGIVAATGIASAAVYDWHMKRETARQTPIIINAVPTSSGHDKGDMPGDGSSLFGNKPWYKGFMDRADSCAPMPSSVTPKADVAADGAHAHIAHAQTSDRDYSLFYTDGKRTWVYSSSEKECRRAVDSWIWDHTIGAA
jgi:hypothetical protein